MHHLPHPARAVARLLLSLSLSLLLSFASARAADATGSLTGNVSNLATGNLLEGARVEIPALNRAALTDKTGRYVFSELLPGAHEIVVTYTGLDPARASVNVAAGAPATRNFDLTTGIYKLDHCAMTFGK